MSSVHGLLSSHIVTPWQTPYGYTGICTHVSPKVLGLPSSHAPGMKGWDGSHPPMMKHVSLVQGLPSLQLTGSWKQPPDTPFPSQRSMVHWLSSVQLRGGPSWQTR